MTPVKAAPFNPAELSSRLEECARSRGFAARRVGETDLLVLTRRTPGPRPRIYLSAGIHGDEPAPPLVLLEALQAGDFGSQANWFICPLLNPDGFSRGSRENTGGIDLNRDYRHGFAPETRDHIGWLQTQPNFDLVICLHEDWEATGFYLYEQNPDHLPSLAQALISGAATGGPIDPSPLIDGREAVGGVIRPPTDPFERELWPESVYLRAHHTRLAYTVESPSGWALDRRILVLRKALEAALKSFLG